MSKLPDESAVISDMIRKIFEFKPLATDNDIKVGLQQEGLDDSDKFVERIKHRRRATAYHESGHGVARVAQNLVIEVLCIIPNEHSNGWYWPFYVADPQDAEKAIVACYAGMCAQVLVDKEPLDADGSGDELNAEVLAVDHHIQLDETSKQQLKWQAEGIVGVYRPAVDALAEELLQKNRLNGKEIPDFVLPFLSGD